MNHFQRFDEHGLLRSHGCSTHSVHHSRRRFLSAAAASVGLFALQKPEAIFASVSASPPEREAHSPPEQQCSHAPPTDKTATKTDTSPNPKTWKTNGITATWIGQSTMLINCMGTWILTDPIFSPVLGINVFGIPLGMPRRTPPALPLDALPKPDLILLSHAHIDHTDLPTLETLTQRYPDELIVISARNTTDVIGQLRWKNVVELDWGHELSHTTPAKHFEENSEERSGTLAIRALEVQHNGARLPFERDRYNGYRKTGRSYNAYRIACNGVTIVFGGDTAYTPAFADLRAEGGVDLAMMPIGAYKDYEHLHCTPEQALQMADAMEARLFMPMHFGTFVQSEEPLHEPLTRLKQACSHAATTVVSARAGTITTILPSEHTGNKPLAQIAHY